VSTAIRTSTTNGRTWPGCDDTGLDQCIAPGCGRRNLLAELCRGWRLHEAENLIRAPVRFSISSCTPATSSGSSASTWTVASVMLPSTFWKPTISTPATVPRVVPRKTGTFCPHGSPSCLLSLRRAVVRHLGGLLSSHRTIQAHSPGRGGRERRRERVAVERLCVPGKPGRCTFVGVPLTDVHGVRRSCNVGVLGCHSRDCTRAPHAESAPAAVLREHPLVSRKMENIHQKCRS
jgi:hypothetical protein